MQYRNFKEVERGIEKLYEQEKYQDALNLLDEAVDKLTEEETKNYLFDILYDKMVLYFRSKMYDECIEVITSLIEQKFACANWIFERLPVSYEEECKKLKERNDLIIAQAQEQAKLEYSVHLPIGYAEEKQYPLFFVLHGDGGNIEEFSEYWESDVFLQKGFIVVYIQSSQVLRHKGYGWLKNPEITRRDVLSCFDLVSKKYLIDNSCILIGGFSGGAIAAVDISVSNVLPIKGFISLCPEIKPDSFTKENVESAVNRGVKGVFMEGEKVIPMPDEEEMIKIFKEVGLPFQYIINKGIGHRAPDDFSEKLNEALQFILDWRE